MKFRLTKKRYFEFLPEWRKGVGILINKRVDNSTQSKYWIKGGISRVERGWTIGVILRHKQYFKEIDLKRAKEIIPLLDW